MLSLISETSASIEVELENLKPAGELFSVASSDICVAEVQLLQVHCGGQHHK